MGDFTTKFPFSIPPVFDWGWFYVPDIGEVVEVEVLIQDEGAEEVFGQAFIDTPTFRWRGKRFPASEGTTPAPLNDVFTSENFGKRRGFYTPKGLYMMFDDTDGREEITIGWTNGTDNSSIKLDSEGKVNINAKGDADQFMVRGNELVTFLNDFVSTFNSHTHSNGNMGAPTGSPLSPASSPPSTVLSTDAKVK
jgi:hypothetical protein